MEKKRSAPHFSEQHIRGQMWLTTFDPANRLVAGELARRWNEALETVNRISRHDEVRRSGGCSLCGFPSDLSKVLVDSKPKR